MFIIYKLDWRKENNIHRRFHSVLCFSFFLLVLFFKKVIFTHLWCHKGSFVTSQKSPSTSEAAGVAAGCKQRAKSAGTAVNLHRSSRIPDSSSLRGSFQRPDADQQISHKKSFVPPSTSPTPPPPDGFRSNCLYWLGSSAARASSAYWAKISGNEVNTESGGFFFFFF